VALKKKTIAAKRSGAKVLIFPAQNRKNVEELQAFISAGLEIHYVKNYDEVFKIAFGQPSSKTSLKVESEENLAPNTNENVVQTCHG